MAVHKGSWVTPFQRPYHPKQCIEIILRKLANLTMHNEYSHFIRVDVLLRGTGKHTLPPLPARPQSRSFQRLLLGQGLTEGSRPSPRARATLPRPGVCN